MKKILFLILASVLSVGLHAQTSNYGHAASLGSNAADAGGDIVGPGSSTNNAFARFSGTTGKLLQDTPDLTYSSPTMSAPDGFVLSSAGSIGLTAGGSNKNVTITPSGTGSVELLLNSQVASTFFTGQGLRVTGAPATSAALILDSFGSAPQLALRRAGGSVASPSAITSGNAIFALNSFGYGSTAYSSTSRASLASAAAQTWTDSNQTTRFALSVVPIQSGNNTTLIEGLGVGIGGGSANSFFAINKDSAAIARATFSTTGVGLSFRATTATDTTSSGTVASAVMHDFGVPTFAASSATTFTNAANLYIAGDVAAGTNVTLTNSYGLWNVGKTRLDGPLVQPPSALTYASPTSVNVALASVYTVTTVNATGSVTFNASAGGTAGQQMTILITNDATSAKTITFGTNFLSTGTLTASAASRHTSITFCSDGTNWYETGRAVMTN